MELQRAISDTIEKAFHHSLENGDSSFLLDTNELRVEDVLPLRSNQDSLLLKLVLKLSPTSLPIVSKPALCRSKPFHR